MTRPPKSKPDAPIIWLRVDKAHIAKVMKVRKALGYGENVRVAR